MRLEEEIAALVPDDGEHLLGFADLTGLLHDKYEGFEHAVVFGKRLDPAVIDAIAAGPTREYYRLYQDTNLYLEGLAYRVAAALVGRGAAALAVTPTMSEEEADPDYLETLRPTFSHKMAATRAGSMSALKQRSSAARASSSLTPR